MQGFLHVARIQGPNGASVKAKTCRAGDDRLRACGKVIRPARLVILTAHALLVVLPVVFGWWLIGPARPWLDEASSAIVMIATAALLLEFLLSGRFRVISAGIRFPRKS
jgi:hypothetical protein